MSAKCRAWIVFLFFCFEIGECREVVFDFPLQEKDQTLFEETCLRLARHSIVKGNFIQTKTISKLSRSFVSEGVFLIADQNGIIWNTQKPYPSLMAVSQSKVIQKNSQGEFQIIQVAENAIFREFSKTIQAVFAGDARELYKRFDIYFLPGKTKESRIGLVPKDKMLRDMFTSIEMTIDSVLKTCLLKEKNEDIIFYEFSNHHFPESLKKEEQEVFLAK